VLIGQQVLFGSSQRAPTLQQTSPPAPSVQTRPPEQQTPPWHTSPEKHSPSPLQPRFAETHAAPDGVVAQTVPFSQHRPLQHAAMGQHVPPQTIEPWQPSQQQLPLTQVSFG
jgi:hypothetical protein